MNNVLLASSGLSVGVMAYGFIDFLVPPSSNSGPGGITAQDALGNPVKIDAWKAAHKANDR